METTSIHGHEVLHMMMESTTAYSRESLITAIGDRFGQEAVFHTCSASGMSAAQLVDLLASHGKFVARGGGFNTEKERMCSH